MLNFFKKNRQTGLNGFKQAVTNIPYLEKRRRVFYFLDFLKYFSLFILAAFLIFLIIISANLTKFVHIYRSAMAGKAGAEAAVFSLRANDFNQARISAQAAASDFNQAFGLASAYQGNPLISRARILRQQADNIVYLLESGQILSQAISQTAEFAADLSWFLDKEEFNFARLSGLEKRMLLKKIYEAAPEMNGIKANLELALLRLERLELNGLLLPVKGRINNVKAQVGQVHDFLKMAVPVSQLLPPIIGYPESSAYLIILQNSDELRPTGGFIGTYGILEMTDGDIRRLDTHDIYHLDMPVKDMIDIAPPEPIKKYLVPKWYMRDANWSPDWPTTALKLQEFYTLENELLPPKSQINNFFGNFDGVIGLTPKLVENLLALIGPVVIEGVEYNSENFVQLLQYRVEKGYAEVGVPSWQRKEVIGQILKEIKIRLFDLRPDKLIGAIDIARACLAEKNLLLFFNDSQMQAHTVSEGWSGQTNETTGDYLMIVDANLGSYKTDAVISRSFDYQVKSEKGKLVSDLKINYVHKGQFDWRTTRYRTYTRIYVPKGSRLVSADGFSEGKPDIYDELGKTVFGVFLAIEPGEIGNLRFVYELPFKPNDDFADKYSLFASKQPGVDYSFYTIDLKFDFGVKSYSPTGFYATKQANGVRWEGELKADMEYVVNF